MTDETRDLVESFGTGVITMQTGIIGIRVMSTEEPDQSQAIYLDKPSVIKDNWSQSPEKVIRVGGHDPVHLPEIVAHGQGRFSSWDCEELIFRELSNELDVVGFELGHTTGPGNRNIAICI